MCVCPHLQEVADEWGCMKIDHIAMACGRALEKGETCFGMGACGAADEKGDCGFTQGLYQAQDCYDAAPGLLYATATVDGEEVQECGRLVELSNGCTGGFAPTFLKYLRASCPVSCGECVNEATREAEAKEREVKRPQRLHSASTQNQP